jgi:hypothetical protein
MTIIVVTSTVRFLKGSPLSILVRVSLSLTLHIAEASCELLGLGLPIRANYLHRINREFLAYQRHGLGHLKLADRNNREFHWKLFLQQVCSQVRSRRARKVSRNGRRARSNGNCHLNLDPDPARWRFFR